MSRARSTSYQYPRSSVLVPDCLNEYEKIEPEQNKTTALQKTAAKTDASADSGLFHQIKAWAIEGSKRFSIGCAAGFAMFCANLALLLLFPNFLNSKAATEHADQTYHQFISKAISTIVIGPIVEEIMFRGVLQSIYLNHLPRLISKGVAPGSEKWFDTKFAKAFRIGFSAFIFGLAHLVNGITGARRQAFGSAMFGIGTALLTESRPGIIGSIGAHMTTNALGYLFIFVVGAAARHKK